MPEPAPAPESAAGLLHHVELYVDDLARSVAFWEWLLVDELGWHLFQQWKSGRSFRKGATYIVLVQTEARHREPPFDRRRTGLNHLAFHADSRGQVDRLTQAIRERGLTLLYDEKHPFAGGEDHYAVYLEDPDRLKVEVVAPEGK